MSRWWRAYDEAVDDAKLILLSDKAHRAWFNLMCIASMHGGVLPDIKVVAVKLRTTVQRAGTAIAELVTAGLFDQRDDGAFEPHNWSGRQFQSDVSTERVKRFRNAKRNVSSAVSETPPETETETETEKISSLRSDSAPAKRKPTTKSRTQLPEFWQLDAKDVSYALEKGFSGEKLRQMSSAFANNHRSKGTLMADWNAAWRTWCDNEIKFNGGRNGNGTGNYRTNPSSGPAPTRDAAVIAGMGRALERRRAARAAADSGREVVREERCAGAAIEHDAERGAASGDDEPSGQLALIPAGDTAA